MTEPLAGIVVVDLSQAVSGSYCSQLLADFGAEVTKIEPLGGEIGRFVGPFPEGDTERNHGGVFQNFNRNKHGIALNLKTSGGKEAILRLVKGADVLVENFSAGVMERLGLGYSVLSELNPRLIYTSIRGFGDAAGGYSPYASWPAFDIVAQAMGGIMGITGSDGGDPVRVGGAVGDTVPGLHAALGTLVALWARVSSGLGQYVDVAMADSVLSIAEVVVNEYAMNRVVPKGRGNTLPGVGPFNSYPASDGVVVLGAPHRSPWLRLCAIMERPDLVEDPRFEQDQDRAQHVAEIDVIISEWTSAHTVAELTELLGGKVPFGPVFAADQIFSDEHFRVRDMLPAVDQPDGGSLRVTGIVPKLSATPGSVRHRAPLLGEHTREVLASVGFSNEEIERLVIDGAAALRTAG